MAIIPTVGFTNATSQAVQTASESFKKTGLFSGDFTERAGKAGLISGVANTIGQSVNPNGTGVVASGLTGAASGAAQGAAITGTPVGAVIGGVLGGVAGLFGATGRRKKAAAEAAANAGKIMGEALQNSGAQLTGGPFKFGSRRETFQGGRRLKL